MVSALSGNGAAAVAFDWVVELWIGGADVGLIVIDESSENSEDCEASSG
jgi:hypothetical protein